MCNSLVTLKTSQEWRESIKCENRRYSYISFPCFAKKFDFRLYSSIDVVAVTFNNEGTVFFNTLMCFLQLILLKIK